MAETNSSIGTGKDARNPKFIWVVVLSGITIILIFIAAYILIGSKGKKLLPTSHPDSQPHSYLSFPQNPAAAPSPRC